MCAHDGFTLADLVTYNDKHNLANGEDNKDGENHNNSWNCGEVNLYARVYISFESFHLLKSFESFHLLKLSWWLASHCIKADCLKSSNAIFSFLLL